MFQCVKGEFAPRINDILCVQYQLTSSPRCKASTRDHIFQVRSDTHNN